MVQIQIKPPDLVILNVVLKGTFGPCALLSVFLVVLAAHCQLISCHSLKHLRSVISYLLWLRCLYSCWRGFWGVRGTQRWRGVIHSFKGGGKWSEWAPPINRYTTKGSTQNTQSHTFSPTFLLFKIPIPVPFSSPPPLCVAALVKVCLSSPGHGEIWKTLKFKLSSSTSDQTSPQSTHTVDDIGHAWMNHLV